MKKITAILLTLLLFSFGSAMADESKFAVLPLGENARLIALSDMQAVAELSQYLAPETLEITKGVVPDGKVNSYLNAYLLQYNGKNILFDTGLGVEQGGQLLEALAQAKVAPEAIDLVVLTHLHVDHSGGLFNNGQEVFKNAQVWVADIEAKYWADTEQFPIAQQGSVAFAKAALTVKNLVLFTPGAEIAPGLTIVDAYGHTPGHTAYLVGVNNKQVLIWGDIIHLPSLQFAQPKIWVVYDVDAAAALKVRERFLHLAFTEKLTIAGMHLVFPGWGTVHKPDDDNDIKYVFMPLQ